MCRELSLIVGLKSFDVTRVYNFFPKLDNIFICLVLRWSTDALRGDLLIKSFYNVFGGHIHMSYFWATDLLIKSF